MPKYLLFVVNDIILENKTINAYDIARILLKNNIWASTNTTANLNRFDKGNLCIVYIAGKDNKYFIANFKISSKPEVCENVNTCPTELKYLVWFFPLIVKIDEVSIWKTALPIKNIIGDLNFIRDKKNYGLYLRHGVRELSKRDYNLIIGSANK